MTINSLHLIASKTLGGEERLFSWIVNALPKHDIATHAVIRRNSAVAGILDKNISHTQTGFRTVWDPLSKLEIQQIIKRKKPDVVHTYMSRAARLTRNKKDHSYLHIAKLCGNYKAQSFVHADAWVVCTHWVADYLVQGGIQHDKIHIIPNFIKKPGNVTAQQAGDFRRQWNIPEDALLIGSVGRLVSVKNIDMLLQAFDELPREVQGRPLHLLIAGDGPLRQQLEQHAGQSRHAANIHFTGWLDQPEIAFAAADIMAFTSHREEGFGLAILEAWAQHKPLITTEALGPGEITHHQVDAWKTPCDNPAMLARGLLGLLQDPALASSLADNGYNQFHSRYSEDVIIGRYADLYQTLLS